MDSPCKYEFKREQLFYYRGYSRLFQQVGNNVNHNHIDVGGKQPCKTYRSTEADCHKQRLHAGITHNLKSKNMMIIICILIAFLLGGVIWANIQERKDFNKGICPQCGKTLRNFDSDSQGGLGYTCDTCGYTTWVSWFNPKS